MELSNTFFNENGRLKLSAILEAAKKGIWIRNIAIKNASSVIGNAKGTLEYNTDILHQSYRQGDDVIMVYGKQLNISELKRILSAYKNVDYRIWIGCDAFEAKIEIDC